MNWLLTTVVGTVVESWQELRVHRGRVVPPMKTAPEARSSSVAGRAWPRSAT